MGWQHLPLAHCKHTSHSQLMPQSAVVNQWDAEVHVGVSVSAAQNIFAISDLRQTDKLFLWVSALCVAHDSVFKETTLKRSVCLLLSGSIRQDDQGCCQELFGDDAQAACCCLLSQHIHHGGQQCYSLEQEAAAWETCCCIRTELRSNLISSFIVFHNIIWSDTTIHSCDVFFTMRYKRFLKDMWVDQQGSAVLITSSNTFHRNMFIIYLWITLPYAGIRSDYFYIEISHVF